MGSTTAKLVLIDSIGKIEYSDYRRHKAHILGTLLSMISRLQKTMGNISICPVFTGSAGMGLAERTGVPFVQEVVAASDAVMSRHPQCKMLIDIGGEDSKMIFFNHTCRPDMRMNGNCAGGTGAFIDQMASLMNVTTDELDGLAQKAKRCHTIASRCGVFAKTDVQNLINTGVSRAEIAASVFQAVAIQAVNSLARGHDIRPPAVLVGGPLYYYRALRSSFIKVLSLNATETILPEMARVYPAYGAALTLDLNVLPKNRLKEFSRDLRTEGSHIAAIAQHEPLFRDAQARSLWDRDKAHSAVPRVPLRTVAGKDIFVGIDAGSTTTKIIVVDNKDQILFRHYAPNKGNPVKSVRKGIENTGKNAGRARYSSKGKTVRRYRLR